MTDAIASLARSVAQRDAAELVKQMGTAIGSAGTMTDEQVTSAMEQILTEWMIDQRAQPCVRCVSEAARADLAAAEDPLPITGQDINEATRRTIGALNADRDERDR